MRDDRTHPLLAQVPLTVSPFVNLPKATTLPYTYRPMPSTLPPSSTGITGTSTPPQSTSTPNPEGGGQQHSSQSQNQTQHLPAYVISPSGQAAAHPTAITASCNQLRLHVEKLQAEAARELAELDRRIREAELAEKRRVAPGWLDSEARLLEPEKTGGEGGEKEGSSDDSAPPPQQLFAQMSLADREGASEMAVDDEGTHMDRAFGGR